MTLLVLDLETDTARCGSLEVEKDAVAFEPKRLGDEISSRVSGVHGNESV